MANWFSSATEEEQERFLKEAEKVASQRKSQELTAGLSLLREWNAEKTKSEKDSCAAYLKIADTPGTPADYDSSAAFRCVQLAERQGNIKEVNRILGYIRLTNRKGHLWVVEENTWSRVEVDSTIEEAFTRVNSSRLTYRAIAWVADLTTWTGCPRFLFVLAFLFGAIRILELPLFIRAIQEFDAWGQNRKPKWPYIVGWYVVEYISLSWVGKQASFLFLFLLDLDEMPMLWLPGAYLMDPVLTVLAALSFAAYYTIFVWFLAKRWKDIFVYIGIYAAVWGGYQYFKVRYVAWGDVYTILLNFSGFLVAAIYRIVKAAQKTAN